MTTIKFATYTEFR